MPTGTPVCEQMATQTHNMNAWSVLGNTSSFGLRIIQAGAGKICSKIRRDVMQEAIGLPDMLHRQAVPSQHVSSTSSFQAFETVSYSTKP